MNKILLVLFLVLPMNLFAGNMKTVGSIDYGFEDSYNITVKASETVVLFETYKNIIVLYYQDRKSLLGFLDAHINLYDKAKELNIDYFRSTGQMICSNGDIRIMFSFYNDKDIDKTAMRMYISYLAGRKVEYIDLSKDQMVELKRLIEESVTDRDELTKKINELNELTAISRKI